jgi:hypothetical protein
LFTVHVGSGSSPSPVEFSSHCHFYKLHCSKVVGRVPLLLPSPASSFIYSSVRDCPSPTLALRVPCSLCYVSFLLLLFMQFVFFSPGWGSVCPGGYADLAQGCLWEYHVLLSSSCGPRLPKPSGRWCLVAVQDPSWFLHLTWSWDAMHGLEVWRSQSFASSRWFFL